MGKPTARPAAVTLGLFVILVALIGVAWALDRGTLDMSPSPTSTTKASSGSTHSDAM